MMIEIASPPSPLRRDLRIVERVPHQPRSYIVRDVVLRGWQHSGFRFSIDAIKLAYQLDGVRTLAEIQQQWCASGRSPFKLEQLADFVQRLNSLHLLESNRTMNLLTGLQRRFERLGFRPPAMANVAYPGQQEALICELESCFGKVELSFTSGDVIRGAIVPHAAMKDSGACAAQVYLSFDAASWPDTFIVVGPDHTRLNPKSANLRPYGLVNSKPFATPLGQVPVDQLLFNAFWNEAHGDLEKGGLPVYREHSLEMQLPFLQFLAIQHNKPLHILPLLLAGEASHHESESVVRRLAMALQRAVKQTNRKVCVLATTDCTHSGTYYGFTDLQDASEDMLRRYDQEILAPLLAGNIETFVARAQVSTYCGILPIWLMAKFLGAYEAGDLFYDVGKAVLAGCPQFVGFASFVLY